VEDFLTHRPAWYVIGGLIGLVVLWSLFTTAGVFLGILAYFRWQERRVAAGTAGTTAPA